MDKLETDSKGYVKEISQIRSTGYELSTPLKINIPTSQSPSLFSSLFTLITPSRPTFNPTSAKQVSIIDDKTFLVTQSNKLAVYRYFMAEDKMQVDSTSCFLLSGEISKIACSSLQWFKKRENSRFILLQVGIKSICLVSLDEEDKAVVRHQIKLESKVLAFKFTSNKNVIVVLENGKILLYSIKDTKMQSGKHFYIKIKQQQTIKTAQITMLINQDSKFYIFFTSYSQTQKRSFLNLVQLEKLDSEVSLNRSFQDIFEESVPDSMLLNLKVYSLQNVFLVHHDKIIWVLQFKFGKYVRADAISEIKSIQRLFVIDRQQHLFLCSFGQQQIQLWELSTKDVGCKCSLLDVLEADGKDLAPKMLASWIFKGNNKIELAFLADHDNRTVELFLTRKRQKMHKLIDRVRKVEQTKGTGKNAKAQFKARVHQVQQLGERLGFQKRQLYLNIWQKNPKTSARIFQYLLPCQDFKIIFKQLQQYMREKKLSISQLVQILKKIQTSLLQQLTKRLDVQLIRQYLKCNFQRRKLKLYSSEIKLDYQQYSQIYQMSLIQFIQRSIDLKLYPQKFYHDILWKEQYIQSPLEIDYILREFRLTILEDYPGFLAQLLQPYEKDAPQTENTHGNGHQESKLIRVLREFNYLLPEYPLKISIVRQELVKLSNIYPSQKIEEHQHFWLGFISEYQWDSEQSSVHYLFNQLYVHYDTSHINEKIKQFCQSNRYKHERNKKYLLIQSSRQQFQQKLPKIYQATSILYLCQSLNRRALSLSQQSQSKAILSIMLQKNRLPEEQYILFLRLSKLQILLISHKLIPLETSIIQLMNMSDIHLVSLFFLGQRAEPSILFQIVSTMYRNYKEFVRIIQQFVDSEVCSKVELEILTRYLYTLKEEDVCRNMEVLNIIVKGYMTRIEIRELDKATDFLALFRDLPLSDELLIKVSLFQSVKTLCYPILRQLGLGKMPYETVITQVDTVIQTLVSNYFSQYFGRDFSIYIEGREILMSYPRNLFVVILYLKDKIYSFRQELQCYLAFGYSLVIWNQFELITQCFSQQLIIDEQELTSEEFNLFLVKHVLSKYLQNEEMSYSQQNKQHLRRLFALIEDIEPLKVTEQAKIKFADLLEQLDCEVSFQYMEIIRQQWTLGKEQRMTIFRQIIDGFVEKVNFSSLKEMYRLLEVMRLGYIQVEQKNEELIQLAKYICGHFVSRRMYPQLCEIIYFLNKGETNYIADSSIMAQCFLQLIVLYQSQKKLDIDKGLIMINFYLKNIGNKDIINQMYRHRFQPMQFEEVMQSNDLQLDEQIRDIGETVVLKRDEIWLLISEKLKIEQKSIIDASRLSTKSKNSRIKSIEPRQKQIQTRDLLFVYFFICNSLQHSSFLFNLKDVSFAHYKNLIILQAIMKINKYSNKINFLQVLSRYMKGLFKIYYRISAEAKQEKITQQVTQKQVKFQRKTIDLQSQIKQIESFDNQKLLILISDIQREYNNQSIYFPLKKLANLYKAERQKEIGKIGQKIVQMGNQVKNTPNIQQPKLSQLKIQAQHPLKESKTEFYISQHSFSRKMHRFSQFERIKSKYVLNSNLTSEKKLVQKVFNDLQQDNLPIDDYNIQSQVHYFSKRLQSEKDEYQFESVLCDLRSQEENLMNQTVMGEFYSIDCIEYDEEEHKKLITLLAQKQYKVIKDNYHHKAIVKAIVEYFYNGADVVNITKGIAEQFGPKKLKRAQTYNLQVVESELAIMKLLDALKNLELSKSTFKLKYLRQSLTLLSSQQLFLYQSSLLRVFSLTVLLDPSKNAKKIAKALIMSVQSISNVDLDQFEKIVKVIDFFICKCHEERKKTDIGSFKREQEDICYISGFYLPFIKNLLEREKDSQEVSLEIRKIMGILGRDKLSEIHDQVLKLLQQKDRILEDYVLSIYEMFESASATF